ncbi:TPA: phage major capsid protein [Streptococcus pyogenes]|uniref:phage major capsid protein n=1 Tax=Streptococcus intermedius TaxID=1338 RepID=UPI000660A001|nr:phage major capsid protein [Streptococcus intermedius]HEP2720958.1 phage major capsid protein [Streptococcus pyogenes]HEP3486114.1 phage major capsid protein [Streptococcus pyogenes]HEP4439492.1 phage major capsid protein [Streptococcus pyogenes]HEP4864490.1 phage major capsid protein [Streptococcus pyogenes]
MDINTLNALWIEAGHRVEDLNEQINNALNDDNFSAEAFENLKNQRDNAKVRRDALSEQLVEARTAKVAAMDDKDVEPLTDEEESAKNVFIKDFKNLVRGNYAQIKNMVSSDETNGAGHAGLTIPKDIQTTIRALVRQYDSLQEYVTVESVSMTSGSRVYEKWSDVTALVEIDEEGKKIGDNDDPELATIKYLIKRYAGITTVTNSLLKDTAENIIAWLSNWIAKKVVVTRNAKILAAIDTLPTKPTLAKWDDIIDLEAKVDPAIKRTSMFLTNTSGFTALKKVKNAMGDYLMERDVKSPTGYAIDGFPVKEVGDRWLADKAGSHPLYFGDLKQAVTLFDRENMSLLATNVGAGAFETDTTKIRVIDRFDVTTVDNEAFVPATFKTIADQEANIKSKE